MQRTTKAILATAALIAAITLIVLPQIASASSTSESKVQDEFLNVNDLQAPVKVDVAPYAAHLLGIAYDKAVAVAAESEPEPICAEVYTYEAPSAYNHDLRTVGVVRDGDTTYTWYSQNVLPGGGLDIPGRHVDGNGFVCDGNGNICVANSDLPHGTVVQTPWGQVCVYDSGCASGIIDVYTAW